MQKPADELLGKELQGGWRVVERVKRAPNATGGHFSVGYLVEQPDGRRGFLKAMDITAALHSQNFVDEMKNLLDTYAFERDVCLHCRESGMTRVVHALDYGSYIGPLGHAGRVEYLIFELADGDVRAALDRQKEFDLAFALRTLHGTAAALAQLHRAGVAHQDLKPSNVLVFSDSGKSKIGDLGRSWGTNHSSSARRVFSSRRQNVCTARARVSSAFRRRRTPVRVRSLSIGQSHLFLLYEGAH